MNFIFAVDTRRCKKAPPE